jgi:hypothetical protein
MVLRCIKLLSWRDETRRLFAAARKNSDFGSDIVPHIPLPHLVYLSGVVE